MLLQPTSAELQELSFSVHQLQSLNSSGRRLGRKISHKKSASDTFAFVAGQDFLALLSERPPLEPAGHARHASSGAGLSGSPTAAADQQMVSDEAQQQVGVRSGAACVWSCCWRSVPAPALCTAHGGQHRPQTCLHMTQQRAYILGSGLQHAHTLPALGFLLHRLPARWQTLRSNPQPQTQQ